MANFAFLTNQAEYKLFANAAIEAEKVYATSPAMCAIGCRKALELAVKWVYTVDNTIYMPYKDNLQSLIHEPTFKFAMDSQTWGKLPFIIKLGNLAVHTEKEVQQSAVILALKSLFEFIQWIDYCYGKNYTVRHFSEADLPQEKVAVDNEKVKQQEMLLSQKDTEIEKLRKQLAKLSAPLTLAKAEHQQERDFTPESLDEYHTRKQLIDVDLQLMGWSFTGQNSDVIEEYPVDDMAGIKGQTGRVDYVLFGNDGFPLAIIEAKRTNRDANDGLKQASLYADCLERKFKRRPMIFTTNGFETYFWDDKTAPNRKVSSIFSKADLQKLMNRRQLSKNLKSIKIDDRITDRYYQKGAIVAVRDNILAGVRKHLLVMATGTGKTRTAASLTDVLSRGGYVTNVLFLADRTALVKQASDDFKNYLPDMSLCNLLTNKDDRNARIVFSTYPTILNAIDNCKSNNGERLFTPAHFDLIIIDESHRSIFKKYKTIFNYFDAYLVGLTATPKTDVATNTYTFFELADGMPTFAYDYETAVAKDNYLVPYYNIEIKLKFFEEGIVYDKLSAKDKLRYEEDFAEDDYVPSAIPSQKLNKFVFNQDTTDRVIQDLMTRGIKVAGGDRLGKSIIFAQNKRHAQFIVERFNTLYPQYKGKFAQRITCEDAYAQTIIDDFKQPEKAPFIAVSVDMLDTGIDVPECVNLVFFKKVYSKTKFWQMIGRGTRLCPGLHCIDNKDGTYTDKRYFFIFDYCGNFEFFRAHSEGFKTSEVKTLSENIFTKQIQLIKDLQSTTYNEANYQQLRHELITTCHGQITALNTQLVAVHLQLRYVEKYKDKAAFDYLTDAHADELAEHIAPLIYNQEIDESAKRFDNFIYSLMIANSKKSSKLQFLQQQLIGYTEALQQKQTIKQIKDKLPLIEKITQAVTDNNACCTVFSDILELETIRKELRCLLKYLDTPQTYSITQTDLTDTVLEEKAGYTISPALKLDNYRKKVNQYITEHSNDIVIHKLTHNIPMTAGDYQELERVFTQELGSKEDYQQVFGDTAFGLLIRQIAKLEHSAIMEAFSQFINDESLNQQQIAFVEKVINYIENSGYINKEDLTKVPFDRPIGYFKLFDRTKRQQLLSLIEQLNNNALQTIA